MKKNIFLALLSICFFGCSNFGSKESFEGVLTYKVIVTPKIDDPRISEILNERNGNLVRIHLLADGSFRKEHVNSGATGFEYLYFDSKESKLYAKFRNKDTLLVSKTVENTLMFESQKDLPRQKVFGIDCPGYQINAIDPINAQKLALTYYFPENKEYVDPKNYAYYKDFFYDLVVAKAKAPYYKSILDSNLFTITYEIVTIEAKKLDKKSIDVPANAPTKVQIN